MIVHGEYRMCYVCMAEYDRHWPEGTTFTTKQVRKQQVVTPHRPGCTNGFKSKVPADD